MREHFERVFAPLRLWATDDELPADFRPQYDLTPPLRPRLRAAQRNRASTDVAVTGDRVRLSLGDLATLDIDAVVNVATQDLSPMSYGLNAAIHRAAGPALQAECKMLGSCPAGDAVVTRGHKMKARWIVHAVPPQTQEHLAATFRNVLRRAADIGVLSLAVPELISGAVGSTARIAVREARAWCRVNARPAQILFCLPDQQALSSYREYLAAA